ncbi:sigma factor binding protein 2, chloroplastic [Trifolium pratense]|nr:sigma factor binding protein 2, chloroplastic [Trifolium pratense]
MDTISTSSTNSIISSLQQTPTKITKSKKKKNKPIKVVYISNPMKVTTSASEFRALVQELTGQYAESPPDPSRYQDFSGDDSSADGGCSENRIDCDKNDHTVVVVPPLVDPDDDKVKPSESFEGFDEDVLLMPQMVENIWDLLPTSAFYESFQLDSY